MKKINEQIITDHLNKPQYDDSTKREVFNTLIYELPYNNDNNENLTAFWSLYEEVKDNLPISSSNDLEGSQILAQVNTYQQIINDSIGFSDGEIIVWNNGLDFYSFNEIGDKLSELDQLRSMLNIGETLVIPNGSFEVWENNLPKSWIPNRNNSTGW